MKLDHEIIEQWRKGMYLCLQKTEQNWVLYNIKMLKPRKQMLSKTKDRIHFLPD